MRSATTIAAALLCAASIHASIVVQFYPASSYNSNTAAMDAALGLTGTTIDGFETASPFPAGLSLTLSGFGFASPVTWTAVPAVFPASSYFATLNNQWDGANILISTPGNSLRAFLFPQLAEFDYAPGASLFGVGLSNFQSTNSPQYPITQHELYVNGALQGTLETLAGANWTPDIVRNAYLKITATGADTITSVGFRNVSAGDALVFDHLALATPAAVPEPASAGLIAAGIAAVALVKRRRRP